jgi:hypothetical protein
MHARVGHGIQKSVSYGVYRADQVKFFLVPQPKGLAFDPRWSTPDVIRLARELYDNKDWDLRPLLLDALEEAGASESWRKAPPKHLIWLMQQILEVRE